MANRKISDLTALTTPATGDLLPIVDISEATAADKNKKITYGTFLSSVPLGSAAAPSFAFTGDINTGIYSPGADTLAFVEGGVEAMRIDSNGKIYLNTTTEPGSNDSVLTIKASSGTKARCLALETNDTANIIIQTFYNPNGAVGTITTSGSSTAYNTSSDYRLKENVTPITNGITRFQQLKPSKFNFIVDPDHTVDGFIAHEAQAVVPECVTGTKDAVDADGNPVFQGIDQSKLVPLLTAALQEAIAKIESLETRQSALEGA